MLIPNESGYIDGYLTSACSSQSSISVWKLDVLTGKKRAKGDQLVCVLNFNS